jgi:hypothetical protein
MLIENLIPYSFLAVLTTLFILGGINLIASIPSDFDLIKKRANCPDYRKQNRGWAAQEWSGFYFAYTAYISGLILAYVLGISFFISYLK